MKPRLLRLPARLPAPPLPHVPALRLMPQLSLQKQPQLPINSAVWVRLGGPLPPLLLAAPR